LEARLATLEAQLATVKAELKKQNTKINTVKAHDAGDNIKWGVDLRTSIDNINYDMADGSKKGKEDLMATRLWLNMEYAPDSNNIFKGQLSYNKAFGADLLQTTHSSLNEFGARGMGYDTFNWFGNESLTNDNIKLRQAYWLYMGEKAFGADIPWTFSVGRRPSTNGFLANLRDDDNAQSPLGHIINVEFDGLSSKLDLSKVTGIPGMSVKLCMGQGSTNATPMLGTIDGAQYSNDNASMQDIKLAGFIVEPYNDGQIVTKATWFRAYDLPGFDSTAFMTAFSDSSSTVSMTQQGDIEGGAFSVLIDGLTEDGYFSGAKIFGSVAYSKTLPYADGQMLGLTMNNQQSYLDGMLMGGADVGESKRGTAYWFGTQLPVTENGTFGLEYNHGSQYWRPFTYGEDTMIGSKLAARGDAKEAYFTWNFSEALSAQLRYTKIDYDYTGSNGFFASGGAPMKISDVKAGAANLSTTIASLTPTQQAAFANATTFAGQLTALTDAGVQGAQAEQMLMMAGFSQQIVEAAQDIRFYIRYRF
jgi:hypothetical protein